MGGLERSEESGGHGDCLSGPTGLSLLRIACLWEGKDAMVYQNSGVCLYEPGGDSCASARFARCRAFAAAIEL